MVKLEICGEAPNLFNFLPQPVAVFGNVRTHCLRARIMSSLNVHQGYLLRHLSMTMLARQKFDHWKINLVWTEQNASAGKLGYLESGNLLIGRYVKGLFLFITTPLFICRLQ